MRRTIFMNVVKVGISLAAIIHGVRTHNMLPVIIGAILLATICLKAVHIAAARNDKTGQTQ